MRVALVLYGGLDQRSGGFLYDGMLVDALRRAGDSVEVFSLPWRERARGIIDGLSPGLRSRLLDWDGECVLEDELAHPTLLTLNRAARRAPAPVRVSIVHHLRVSEAARPGRISRAVERAYLQGVTSFLFNSTVTRRSVETLLGRPAAGIVVTPGGDRLGPELREEQVVLRAGQGGPLRVLFIGNLIHRKGVHTLIDALARLGPGRCLLTIVGSDLWDARYAARLRRSVSILGMSDAVRFTGALPDDALAAELRSHHVLAVPSLYEGFGIVYLEAMRFGLVPIGSASGGAAEIIEDGRSGYLVPPESPKTLARRLARLAGDTGLRTSLGLGALRRSADFPGWEEGMARARAFLSGLAAGRGT
jgi:glycosyltransferase involved in cell wall biosynthesis